MSTVHDQYDISDSDPLNLKAAIIEMLNAKNIQFAEVTEGFSYEE